MLWNELDYKIQLKVIDCIVDLIKNEDDEATQDGLMSAIHELQLWSNGNICQVVDGVNSYYAPANDLYAFEDLKLL